MQKNNVLFKNLFGISLLAAASVAAAQGVLTGVDVRKTEAGVEVFVRGEGLAQPTLTRANKGTVFISSYRGVLKAPAQTVKLNHGGVTNVQWVQFTTKPPVCRVVLRLRPTDKPVLSQTDDGWKITVDPANTVNNPITNPNSNSRSSVTPVSNGNNLPSIDEGPAANNPGKVVKGGSVVTPVNPFLNTITGATDKTVILEFDNADVNQVLKALAIQAGLNIVTAPGVKGEVTIKLDRVSVDEALSVITAVSGLRYGRVGKTIVVATPDRIGEILSAISKSDPSLDIATETRVIPIYSKQAKQVKNLAYRQVNQVTKTGRYEIILPSENVPNPIPGLQGAPTDGATKGEETKPADTKSAASSEAKPEDYVMVVGQRARLDEVERIVREIDNQLCDALGIEVPTSTAIVQKTYAVKGVNALSLVNALGAKEGKVGDVQVRATPAESNSPQMVVLVGREHEVNRLVEALEELDGTGLATDKFTVYEISYTEPRSLRDEIVSLVPGVRASIAPGTVGTPRLYNNRGASVSVGNTVNSPQVKENGGGSGSTTNEDKGGPKGTDGFNGGLGQPFNEMEPNAQPMRLILRGSDEQISNAMKVLKQLDIPPKMVALEVRIMELSKDDANNIGLDWSIFTGGAVKFIKLSNTYDNPKNSVGVNINDKNFQGDVIGTLDRVANDSNLIARPNMIAPDGRESELFIGDAIRYVESITSSTNGPSVQIGTVRVGINLAVLPRISDDGTVTLDMRPVVSFLRGFNKVSVQGFAAELPQTSERITQQTITMKSGETFAISGLIQDQDTKQMSGVPILMDLPLVGQLFRRTTTTKVRRELVIFVSAKSLTGPLTSAMDERATPEKPKP